MRFMPMPMPMPSIIRSPIFVWCCCALLLVALGFVAWNAATGQNSDAFVWCGIAVIAALIIHSREQIPPFHGFLLSLAVAVNGAGYTMTLWHEETLFDEIVHAFTTFAGLAAIGWALVRRGGKLARSRAALSWSLLGLALMLGLLWEVFEYWIGIIGTPKDTAIDLAMDMIGACAAAALSCWIQSRARA
jgi:NAD/NADP transhydrogenase beta subunit